MLTFRTSSVESADRLDALNTFSRGLYTYSPCELTGAAPRLDLNAWALDELAAASISYGPTRTQTSDQLDESFEDQVFLRWVRTGHVHVAIGDEIHKFGPRSLFLMQPGHHLTAIDEGTSLSLRLPFARVGYDPLTHPPVVELCQAEWQVRVLVAAIEALFDSLPWMAPKDSQAIAAQLVGLIRSVITSTVDDEETTATLCAGRARAMRRYIVDNLSRTDLGVRHLQSQFNASRATVYRAFDDVGGVASYVRHQRLAAAHRALRHARPARGVIRRVAEQNGLSDQTNFLRMFRAEYGVRPSDVLGLSHAGTPQWAMPNSKHANVPCLAAFWSMRA